MDAGGSGRRVSGELLVVAALAFASSVCAALLAVRFLGTGRLTHAGLAWNLFLAWLPVGGAMLTAWALRGGRPRLVTCAAGGFWLLFFPNAPYLVTDLIHLRHRPPMPLWYDLILVASFAWTGFLLGVVSLRLMQGLVHAHRGPLAGWAFVLVAVALASFGIYLGRFERFNSWDVLTRPQVVLVDVAHRVLYPWEHPRTVVFSLAFGLFFLSTYAVVVASDRLKPAPEPVPAR